MILVDTSVWVRVWRDSSGAARDLLDRTLAGETPVFSRCVELELLQGARDEHEWLRLADFLATQVMVDPAPETWASAARLFYDLRRRGRTIRSLLDCLIAQTALEHDLLLVHFDRDFETVAEIRPLRQVRLEFRTGPAP